MIAFIQRTVRFWIDAVTGPGIEQAGDQSASERFPLPFTFKPRLTFWGACIAVSQALVRIFAGSILFGVCGASAWIALEHIPNPVLRAAALIPMGAVFLTLLALLMVAISMLFRAIFPVR